MIDEITANAQGLAKMIFSMWNLLLITLVWIGLHTLQERFSEWFEKPKIGWRMLPYLPSMIIVPLTFVPGPWFPPDIVILPVMRVMLGLAMGIAAFNLGGMLNRAPFVVDIVNKLGINLIVEKTGGGKEDTGP